MIDTRVIQNLRFVHSIDVFIKVKQQLFPSTLFVRFHELHHMFDFLNGLIPDCLILDQVGKIPE